MCIRDRHTKWSRFVTTIESCINEKFHETIEITPYEAHLGRKPTRVWEKYIDKEVTGYCQPDKNQILVKMRMKREKQAKKINEDNKTTKFEVGDLVLIRIIRRHPAANRQIL